MIARLRDVRANAVTANEVSVCKLLYTAIKQEHDIEIVLADDAALFRPTAADTPELSLTLTRRNAEIAGLLRQANATVLPQCDGFPKSPTPNPTPAP